MYNSKQEHDKIIDELQKEGLDKLWNERKFPKLIISPQICSYTLQEIKNKDKIIKCKKCKKIFKYEAFDWIRKYHCPNCCADYRLFDWRYAKIKN